MEPGQHVQRGAGPEVLHRWLQRLAAGARPRCAAAVLEHEHAMAAAQAACRPLPDGVLGRICKRAPLQIATRSRVKDSGLAWRRHGRLHHRAAARQRAGGVRPLQVLHLLLDRLGSHPQVEHLASALPLDGPEAGRPCSSFFASEACASLRIQDEAIGGGLRRRGHVSLRVRMRRRRALQQHRHAAIVLISRRRRTRRGAGAGARHAPVRWLRAAGVLSAPTPGRRQQASPWRAARLARARQHGSLPQPLRTVAAAPVAVRWRHSRRRCGRQSRSGAIRRRRHAEDLVAEQAFYHGRQRRLRLNSARHSCSLRCSRVSGSRRYGVRRCGAAAVAGAPGGHWR
mmetsp:Transcript_89197/g.257169  ORF Transcript_89197/g.257169 Transcript_89197/m.257169 type:complete len:342 (-) Transcript_89197:683-1708(-)